MTSGNEMMKNHQEALLYADGGVLTVDDVVEAQDREAFDFFLLAIEWHLRDTEARQEMLDTISFLRRAIKDIDKGIPEPLLQPRQPNGPGHPGLHDRNATTMAYAAGAVTLADRSQFHETARRAARKLGVTEQRLLDFRKNLKSGKIKHKGARVTYYVVASGRLPSRRDGNGGAMTVDEILDIFVERLED